jgi:hypothetical protein
MPLSKEKRSKYMRDYYKKNPEKYLKHKERCNLNAQNKRKKEKDNVKI